MKNVIAAFEERQRRADAETRSFAPTPIEVGWLELADAIGKTVAARDVPLHIAVALDAEETRWRWSQLGDYAVCIIVAIPLNSAIPAWTALRVLAVADAIAASVAAQAPSLMDIAARLRESTFAPQGRTFDGVVAVVLKEVMQYVRGPGPRLDVALAYDAMQHAAERIVHTIAPLTMLFLSAREAGVSVGEILRAMGPPTASDVFERVAGRV
jgi:hypothetical protein